MGDPLIIGRFGKPFGVFGWIKVISFTDPSDNILKFKRWLIQKNNGWEELYIDSSKKHASNIVVKLPNISSPEEAKHFTNIKIAVLREELPKLKKTEHYWTDFYGLEVINKEGVSLGIIKSLIATGSNDVLVVEGGKKRYLIPYLSYVVIDVDLANKKIVVDWPEDYL
jgi:16S rRNA processing protein RimM